MRRKQERAFSRVEVLCSAAMVLLFLFLLWPRSSGGERRGSRRTKCVSNQKQMALAALTWANDGDRRFPWQPSAGTGLDTSDAARIFSLLSNELVVTDLLRCPADKERPGRSGSDFAALQSKDISYFTVVDTAYGSPNEILFGDRDVRGWDGKTRCSVVGLPLSALTARSEWESKLHPGAGNVAMSDGGVQMLTSAELGGMAASNSSPCRVSHLLMP